MKLLSKLALLAAAALLLHAKIMVVHLNHASKLKSGEWTQADAEAIGAVWNLNGSGANAATQPTTGE